ncbi:MAG: response regulator transcription factor [Bacteroidales bacterium]|jgi:DNA-binding NarL/FixJ family response regulator|nr:response regulator transcription factor [Bacteroidales bacterium]
MTTEETVLIVDDHTLFRNGLKLLLGQYFPNMSVREVGNGSEAVDYCDKIKLPDIILMDINMPVMNGIEATKTILTKHPQAAIIALTMHGDHQYYYQMIEAGAKGFLLKDADPEHLMLAIKQVKTGRHFFSEEILYGVIRNIHQFDNNLFINDLSRRETEILQLICAGFSNSEIGEKLFISKRTVDNHRAKLLEKTQSKNTAQLVIYAIKSGLIRL